MITTCTRPVTSTREGRLCPLGSGLPDCQSAAVLDDERMAGLGHIAATRASA